MDPLIASAAISAGSNLAAGLLAGDGPDSRIENRKAAYGAIQGKIQAADQFGISRLYALGAPTGSPIASVGGEPSLSETVSRMGGDISRAVAAGQTSEERALQALALEKAGLENDYLRSQINSVNLRTMRESGPPMPGPTDIFHKVVPPQRTDRLKIAGVPVRTAPAGSDAQTFEDRYGELGGSLLGLSNIPLDAAYTFWRWLKSGKYPNYKVKTKGHWSDYSGG